MCGLWGGVNPRFSDDLFEFLFPAGYQGLMWTPLILGIFITLYLIGTWALRHYTSQDQRSWRDVRGELAIVVCIGFFLMPVAVALGLCLGAKAATYIQIVLKTRPERQDQLLSGGKKFLLWGVGAWSKALFVLVPALGIFLMTEMEFADIAWCLLIGAITAIIIIGVRKISRLPNFIRPITLTRRSKRVLKVVAILFPVVCSVTLYWETLGKTFLPVPAPTGIPTTLKIVTYNIRLYKTTEPNPANNWVNRKDDVVAYIESLGADIIGVQEAYLVQLQDILAGIHSIRYQFTGLGRENGVHVGEHAAILFNSEKFRLIDGDTFWLSNCTFVPSKQWDESNYRICTWARFEVISTSTQFCVFNTHYGFGNNFDAKASALICGRITSHSGDLPTFAMGDFNMYNTSQGYSIFENYANKPMKDAYRLYNGNDSKVTSTNNWTTPNTSSRIDFVFCSPGIIITNASIPMDYRINGQTYSDHYPVVIQCAF